METHHWLEQRAVGKNKRRSLAVQDMQVLRAVPLLQSSTGTEECPHQSCDWYTFSLTCWSLSKASEAGRESCNWSPDLLGYKDAMPAKLTCQAPAWIISHAVWQLPLQRSVTDGSRSWGSGLKTVTHIAETGGLGSNSQIHTFLPNPPSAPFLVWADNTQVYGKGAGEKPCVGYLVLSLGI